MAPKNCYRWSAAIAKAPNPGVNSLGSSNAWSICRAEAWSFFCTVLLPLPQVVVIVEIS
jgi:hypothetical protein